MNVLWFSWKDIKNPAAGGAETVSFELMKRLAKDGHRVKLITSLYPNAIEKDNLEGVEVYRTGNRFSVYIKACLLFKRRFKNWPDLLIDEMNTIPFGVAFYSKKPSFLLTYQLARQVWFYQMIFPLSLIGYLVEPIYLFVLSKKYKQIMTESESTRQDLMRFGFNKERIGIIRVGTSLQPIEKLRKKQRNLVLSLGAMRPMKRTLHAVKAFEFARDINSNLQMIIAGDSTGAYANKVTNYINASRHASAIQVLGRVSAAKRLELMREATIIVVTSIKEGWGLIVTEANSQGTPAIAYDSNGLRDSIQDKKTGLLVPIGNTKALGIAICNLITDQQTYKRLRVSAWKSSQEFTFENSYKDFLRLTNIK